MKLRPSLVALLALAALAGLPAARAQEPAPAPTAAAEHDHAHGPGDGHDHGHDGAAPVDAPRRAGPWSERTLELAGSLPVQEGGRIKPLSTFARFALLSITGRKSVKTPSDEKLDPTGWYLDTVLAPERAATYPLFLVPDAEAAHALGLDIAQKKKRDRWSYDELTPGLPRLMQLAAEYSRIEAKERESVEQHIVALAQSVRLYESIAHTEIPALVPPAGDVEQEPSWWTFGEVFAGLQAGARLHEDQRALLLGFDRMQRGQDRPAEVEQGLEAMHAAALRLAQARGEGEKVPLESLYYRTGLLGWGQILFVFAFLAAAVLWLRPRSRIVYGLTNALVVGGTACLVGAIVLRCMIRGRPPVSTLYETLLFVAAVGALVALGVEAIGRRRIAVSAAAFFGAIGLFLANGYETLDGKDTMPTLVAVLDTNFWLSTHVTSITIGYSAGMLAAVLASFYLGAKALGYRLADRSWYASLGRMVYGVLAFSLIFSIVGTILGGVWANESWGRFWGWDPKENGALLICLSQIAMLHGRMGGYLREHGLCAAVALGGIVIAFSWFGVNLLGVGLHSYGFTSGINLALLVYYLTQLGIVVVLGSIGFARERALRRVQAAGAAAPTPRSEPRAQGTGERGGRAGEPRSSPA